MYASISLPWPRSRAFSGPVEVAHLDLGAALAQELPLARRRARTARRSAPGRRSRGRGRPGDQILTRTTEPLSTRPRTTSSIARSAPGVAGEEAVGRAPTRRAGRPRRPSSACPASPRRSRPSGGRSSHPTTITTVATRRAERVAQEHRTRVGGATAPCARRCRTASHASSPLAADARLAATNVPLPPGPAAAKCAPRQPTKRRTHVQTITTVALAVAVAATTAAVAVPGALAKDGDVRVKGTCTTAATSKLKLSAEDGGIEVEFEVDQNRNGVPWRVTLRRNGSLVASTTATTRAPSGSFSVRRVVADAPAWPTGSSPSRRARAAPPAGRPRSF